MVRIHKLFSSEIPPRNSFKIFATSELKSPTKKSAEQKKSKRGNETLPNKNVMKSTEKDLPKIKLLSGQVYKCNQCDIKSRKYSVILGHMAKMHYRAKLSGMHGGKKWDCGLCQQNFKSEFGLACKFLNFS